MHTDRSPGRYCNRDLTTMCKCEARADPNVSNVADTARRCCITIQATPGGTLYLDSQYDKEDLDGNLSARRMSLARRYHVISKNTSQNIIRHLLFVI